MSAPRFDGAALWATLPPEAQAELGAAALELVSAQYLEEEVGRSLPVQSERVAAVASGVLGQRLHELFGYWIDLDELNDVDGTPLVPSLVGAVCRACGCSQTDACFPACGWAEEDLCTACVGGPS